MTPPPPRRPASRATGLYRLAALLSLLAVVGAILFVVVDAGGGQQRHPVSPPARAAVSSHKPRPTHKRHKLVPRRPAPTRITGEVSFSLTLNEPSSAAIATTHSATGQPVRALPTTVRYPTGTGLHRYPLVVFSEGYNEPAAAYFALLDAWTRAGYVVASPTYPLTDPTVGPVNEADIVNHPADLRFVISALRAAAGNPRSPLHRVTDPTEVGIAGQSDGGDVSLAVAANSCCRDPAVKAALILSGAELAAFGGTYYGSQGSAPLLVSQGTSDPINVPGCSFQLYDQAPAPKFYLSLVGEQHLPPYIDPGPVRQGIELVTIAFLNAFLKHDSAALTQARRRLPSNETLTSGPTAPGPPSGGCPGAP